MIIILSFYHNVFKPSTDQDKELHVFDVKKKKKKTFTELIMKPFHVFYIVLTLSQTSPGFYMSAVQAFRNEQFLLFPKCFLPIFRTFFHFHQI